MNWGHYLCFPKAENSESCEWWQSDGLEEWEREALVTVDISGQVTVAEVAA